MCPAPGELKTTDGSGYRMANQPGANGCTCTALGTRQDPDGITLPHRRLEYQPSQCRSRLKLETVARTRI